MISSAARLAAFMVGLAITPASGDEARLDLGRKVFLEISEPRCGRCHTLADAGTTGKVGPSLDDMKPDAARVKTAIVNGIGPMPANETLREEQVDAVALYVSAVAGKTK
ncbi:c-type cytochrome [Ensifer aridi]|uniref:SorU family sulfite dehydrogenase c-type cytochrome subunit n=1 Tax=Ensifer aridi TaxID=1708715 RepID=UPI000A11783F|nr:cytochrome c [Ensifer aridi]